MSAITASLHSFLISTPTKPTAPKQTRSPTCKPLRLSRRASMSSGDLHSGSRGRNKFLEFPYASASVRKLMVELVSLVEDRLGSQLLPCSVPEDVQFYQSENGSSEASLQIRSASLSSQVDHFTYYKRNRLCKKRFQTANCTLLSV